MDIKDELFRAELKLDENGKIWISEEGLRQISSIMLEQALIVALFGDEEKFEVIRAVAIGIKSMAEGLPKAYMDLTSQD